MNQADFKLGLKSGLPICLGYFSVSFAFGMAVSKANMPVWIAVLISMTNLTSAGQFAGINLMMNQAVYFEIALTTLIINLRYALMSLTLSQKVDEKMSLLSRLLISFGITDEIFAMAASRKEAITTSYMAGMIILPFIGWTGGTFLGAVASSLMPQALSSALGIAIYGMFIAIIVPPSIERKPVRNVIVLAIVFSYAFKYLPFLSRLSSGWTMIIITIIVSMIAAIKDPIKVEEE